MNAGVLTAEMLNANQPEFQLTTPILESGEEQVVIVSFSSTPNMPNILFVTYSVADKTVTRYIEVMNQEKNWDIANRLPLILAGSFLVLLGGVAILAGVLLVKWRML